MELEVGIKAVEGSRLGAVQWADNDPAEGKNQP